MVVASELRLRATGLSTVCRFEASSDMACRMLTFALRRADAVIPALLLMAVRIVAFRGYRTSNCKREPFPLYSFLPRGIEIRTVTQNKQRFGA